MRNGCLPRSFENLAPYLNDYRYECAGPRIYTPFGCSNVESLATYRIIKVSPFTSITEVLSIDFIYELPYINRHYSIDSNLRKITLPNGVTVGDLVYITNSSPDPTFYVYGQNIQQNGVVVKMTGSTVGLKWNGSIWEVVFWGRIETLPTSKLYIEKVTYLDGSQEGAVYSIILRLFGYTNFVLIPKDEPSDPDLGDNEITLPDAGLTVDSELNALRYIVPNTEVTGPVTTQEIIEPLAEDTRFNYHEFSVTSPVEGVVTLDLEEISPWYRLEYNFSKTFDIYRDFLMVQGFQLSFINSLNSLRDPFDLGNRPVSQVYWIKTLAGRTLGPTIDYTLESDEKVYPTESGKIFNSSVVILHYE